MTFCRVFINRQNEKVYQTLFERVFFLMQNFTKKFIEWQHIHDKEFHDVVMNMNLKQINDNRFFAQQINKLLLMC